ncbi:MAG: hypothetical protein IJ365_02525 [Clostridia bacterium]|nr:hypothetical protein [Clostridia bacterium]
MAKAINCLKIKNEYISTDISQRKLAEKHDISFNTLKAKANKEKWSDEKKQLYHKITTKVQQETSEKIVKNEVERITDIVKLSDKVIEKIEKAIGQLENAVVNGEVVETGIVDTYKLRQIVQSMKDLKDITDSSKVADKDNSVNITLNWKRE